MTARPPLHGPQPPRATFPRLLVGVFFCVFAAGAAGCVTRQSTESLRKQIADLQQENFQLRKDLAEARVRLEMQRDVDRTNAGPAGTGPTGGGPAAASGGEARAAAGAPPAAGTGPPAAKSDAPRVIYSEPITDASRYKGGSGASGSSSPARLMKTARERLDAKDAAGALSLFSQIVSRYPEDALADDAQFGVGECYFQMGNYEQAIAEYMKVVNNFPFGDQVPSAFLKIGFAHLAREQRVLALDNFKTVSEAYPGTEAATVARQQIAHLSRLSTDASGDKPTSPKH